MENNESNMANWYYILDNQRFGPVSGDTIASLLTHHVLDSQSMVSSDEGGNWQLLWQTAFWNDGHATEHHAENGAPATFDASSWNSSGMANHDAAFETKINDYYFYFWLLTVIGLPLLLILVGLIPLLVATVFACFILYHAWKAIPNNSWQVPPILAVLLLFVPVVDLIWYFWAFYFMSKEMNQSLAQYGNTYRINESLVLTYCILTCIASVFCYIPTIPTFIIGVIVLVPTSIVGLFSMRSIKDGLLALHPYQMPRQV